MKIIPAVRRIAILLVVSNVLCLSAVAAKSPLLRYRGEGQTNVFKVSIESRGESGTEKLEGNLIVTTKSPATNVIALTFSGTLMPKRDAGALMEMGMIRSRRFAQPISLTEGCNVLIDAQGGMLRSAGDHPFSFPLGSVAQLFVMRLPVKAESEWKTSEEVAVMDDPMGLGPVKSFTMSSMQYGMHYGYYPGGRNVPGVLLVRQNVESEITNSTATTVSVWQKTTITSPLLAGNEPRISASGQGTKVFDVQGGFLRSAQMQYEALLNTESSTRRTTARFQVELLEGKEREAVLMPMTDRPVLDAATGQYVSRKLTGEDLQNVFNDLKSDSDVKRRAATARWQSSEIVDPPQAIVDFMTNHLFSSDTMMKMVAVKMVADFGSNERVPELLRLLKSGDSFNRNNVIQALGRLKDPRAIAPLVDCIAKGDSDSHAAKAALVKFGAEAEDAVLVLLKENHSQTKRTACEILQEIGTAKSIAPLKEVVGTSDQYTSNAAAEALRVIQSRQ